MQIQSHSFYEPIRHIPDTKRPPYPLWRRYVACRGLLKRAVRTIVHDPEPLVVRYLHTRGLHVKMLIESPEPRYVAHLSAARGFGEHIYRVHRAAMDGGAPTQYIVGATESLFSRLRSGLGVVVLNYVHGQSNNDLYTVDQCRSFGRTLALLHNVKAPFWGSPALRLPAAESRPQMLAEWAGLQHDIAAVPGFPWLVDEPAMNAWLRERTGFLGKTAHFSLVHGDPHQNNVIFDSEGTAHLIDLDTAEYAIPAVETARVLLMSHCGLDPGRQGAFLEGYLERASAETRQSWTEHAAMATVVAMLVQVSANLGKAFALRKAGNEGAADACLDAARRLWLWRQHVVAANPAPGANLLSLVDCAPEHGRLNSDSARLMRDMRKDPAVRHPLNYHLVTDQGWVF